MARRTTLAGWRVAAVRRVAVGGFDRFSGLSRASPLNKGLNFFTKHPFDGHFRGLSLMVRAFNAIRY